MGGRISGGIVLLVAVVSLLVVPRVTGPGLAGTARMAPAPPPPTVGSCIVDPVSPIFDDGGWMRPLPEWMPGDCGSPHWGEVSVVAELPDGAENGERLGRCWASRSAAAYLTGPAPDGPETAALSYEMTALGPDRQQFAAGQRWLACVLHGSEPLTGSVAGVAGDGAPPPTLGRCYDGDFASFQARDVPCRTPHGGELFAYLRLDLADPPAPAEVDAWCAAAVERATGRTGLTEEPGLGIGTGVFAWFDDRQSRFVTLPVPADARGASAFCGVRAFDGRVLVSSLRQLGNAAVPWAG